MMTTEEKVYAVLSQVGDAYIEHLPTSAPIPAVVYQRVGGDWEVTNCHQHFVPEIRICVFAQTPTERAEWVERISQLAAENLWQPESKIIFEYDYPTKSYCAIWSYLVDF